jgi:biopolymer transport protein ExbB
MSRIVPVPQQRPLSAALAIFVLFVGLMPPVAAFAQTQPATVAPAASHEAPGAPAPPASTASATTPAIALATPPAPPLPEVMLKLPRDLSPWGMFMAADIVVKAVMIGLVLASVLSWTIWFAKAIELMIARCGVRSARSPRRAHGAMRQRSHGVTAMRPR